MEKKNFLRKRKSPERDHKNDLKKSTKAGMQLYTKIGDIGP